MSRIYSISALRADLYRLLDAVLATGRPLEVERNGARLKIVPAQTRSRLALLRATPGYLRDSDPETLVHLDWSDEWRG